VRVRIALWRPEQLRALVVVVLLLLLGVWRGRRRRLHARHNIPLPIRVLPLLLCLNHPRGRGDNEFVCRALAASLVAATAPGRRGRRAVCGSSAVTAVPLVAGVFPAGAFPARVLCPRGLSRGGRNISSSSVHDGEALLKKSPKSDDSLSADIGCADIGCDDSAGFGLLLSFTLALCASSSCSCALVTGGGIVTTAGRSGLLPSRISRLVSCLVSCLASCLASCPLVSCGRASFCASFRAGTAQLGRSAVPTMPFACLSDAGMLEPTRCCWCWRCRAGAAGFCGATLLSSSSHASDTTTPCGASETGLSAAPGGLGEMALGTLILERYVEGREACLSFSSSECFFLLSLSPSAPLPSADGFFAPLRFGAINILRSERVFFFVSPAVAVPASAVAWCHAGQLWCRAGSAGLFVRGFSVVFEGVLVCGAGKLGLVLAILEQFFFFWGGGAKGKGRPTF
jgi:hypothetical protein